MKNEQARRYLTFKTKRTPLVRYLGNETYITVLPRLLLVLLEDQVLVLVELDGLLVELVHAVHHHSQLRLKGL